MIVNNIENWMLPKEAINWIYDNIPSDSSILELGSGFGTEILSKKYKMTSIEQDEEWLYKFDTNYIYAPIENGFYKIENLSNLPKKYDLLIIDGPTQISGGRMGFIKNIDLFFLDCTILIDDVHREEEMEILTKLSNLLKRNYKIFNCDNKKFAIIEK
jgi:hypothetical protein